MTPTPKAAVKEDAMETACSIERPRVVSPAFELAETERYCTCCKRELKGNVAWLELDQRTNTYHDFGNVPEEKSQGWFPFGIACARTSLRKARGE